MNHLSLAAVVLHGASCILCDGHSFISNQGRVCTSRRAEGDVVLLRAHRLRRLPHGARQVGLHLGAATGTQALRGSPTPSLSSYF